MTSLFIPPRVPLADPASGICNPIWYRFFSDMFASFSAGGGAGGVLMPSGGGTGIGSYTPGDLIYASGTTTLSKLHASVSGNALISNGEGFPPAWGKIGLTTHVDGLLPVANGGSGAASLTGHLSGNGASPFTASATIPGADISGDIPGNAANVTGVVAVPNGGSGGSTFTGYLKGNGAAPFTASATIPGADITGAALTKTDDTNVTLTLGGTPATALLRATSLTLGWTGQLSVARGGTGVNTSTGTGSGVHATQPQFTSTIGVGVAASASGAGVSFPATQSASTDPNTLDDYEEGTWTPVVTAGGGTITAYTATGSYTKIGRQVTASFVVTITNNGTGSTLINVTLPFTAGSAQACGAGREAGTSGHMLQVPVQAAATSAVVVKYDNSYPGGTGNILVCTVVYFV